MQNISYTSLNSVSVVMKKSVWNVDQKGFLLSRGLDFKSEHNLYAEKKRVLAKWNVSRDLPAKGFLSPWRFKKHFKSKVWLKSCQWKKHKPRTYKSQGVMSHFTSCKCQGYNITDYIIKPMFIKRVPQKTMLIWS